MVVKNQKNLIHDVVMNYIPKKKVDPPKVSLEQMVKEHTKLLAECSRNNTTISPIINKVSKDTHLQSVQQHQNIINEIEKKVIDKPIIISKVEPFTISDIVSFGGEIQKKPNSRRRSRNHVKSTVEKLIDTKLKSEFIENLISNNSDNRHVVQVQKAKSPSVVNYIDKNNENKVKSLINNNININHTKTEKYSKSPITKKFKSENNIIQKPKVIQNKEQLFKIPTKMNNNIPLNKLKDNIYTKRQSSVNDRQRQSSVSDRQRQRSVSDRQRQSSVSDRQRQNRTNNYLKNASTKKSEAEINLNSFRDYEIKIKNSRKKSKKSDRKKSKKSRGSKKNSNGKSKNKSRDISNNIKLDKAVPDYLKTDLKRLIGNNITINNDNFNFNKN